ncbi:hypothetical protein JCM18882A_32820 [Brevibacterium metallidurans]|uniref:Uncharacterized protein n=1 Tax=Brevibacterium metallidurans TaxID=1482676 RepID=A0ABN0SS62_9MICO
MVSQLAGKLISLIVPKESREDLKSVRHATRDVGRCAEQQIHLLASFRELVSKIHASERYVASGVIPRGSRR